MRITLSEMDWENITPLQIKAHESEQMIRAEYTAARDVIRKRIKQVESSKKKGVYKRGIMYRGKMRNIKFDPTKFGFYQKYKNGVPQLRALSIDQAIKELSEMKAWIKRDESTVTGLVRQSVHRVSAMRKAGYSFVNMKNLADFGNFMEYSRTMKLDKQEVGSPEVAEMYAVAKTYDIDYKALFDDFKNYVKHKDIIESMDPKEVKGDPNMLRKALKMEVRE